MRTGRRRRSIGAQRALGRRGRTPAELDETVIALVDRLCRRMRRSHRLCRTVVLRLRFGDYTRATRSRTLFDPTSDTRVVLAAARGLLLENLPLIRSQGITLIGISLTNLADDAPIQLALPLDRAAGLDAALDRVVDRYGAAAITRARLLHRPDDPTVPMFPD